MAAYAALVLGAIGVGGITPILIGKIGSSASLMLIPCTYFLVALLVVPTLAMGRVILTIGWITAAFTTDSNIVDPVVSGAGEVSLSFTKVAPLALILVGSVFLLMSREKEGAGISLVIRLLIIYAGWQALAALVSPVGSLVWLRWVQGAVPVLGLYALATSRSNPRLLLMGTSLTCFVHVVLAWFVPNAIEPAQNIVRVGGFLHPTILASAGSVIICWGVWFIAHKTWHAALPGIALVSIGLWATLSSRSRMGFVALIVASLAVLFIRGTRTKSTAAITKRVTFLVGAMSGAFLAAAAWGAPIFQWFAREEVSHLRNLTGRTYLWKYVMRHVYERPIFGWGPGALRAGELSEKFRLELGFAGQAHNGLMEALITAGVVGGVLWLSLMLSLGRSVLLSPSPERPLLFGIWVVMVATSVSDGGTAWFGLVWYVLLSLIGTTVHKNPGEQPPHGVVVHEEAALPQLRSLRHVS